MQHRCDEKTYELEAMARRLDASGDYKVLRRLVTRPLSEPAASGSEQIGIVIDLETTGLDHGRDEVIELAMVKFRFGESGTVTGVSAVFQGLQQPSAPIPPEITRLTGITDAMVAGQTIDSAAVDAFVADATLLIAHNAGFDRKFAERTWPVFEHKPWACSATEIAWKDLGFSGAKLTYLVAEAGFFYGAHRAIDDCHAVLELLGRPIPPSPQTALGVLLERVRRTTCRIFAEHSPYDLKDVLKRRGYRWNDGSDGSLRSWYIDVDADDRETELKFLRQEIYQREAGLRCVEYSALGRFSARTGVGRGRSVLPPKVASDA